MDSSLSITWELAIDDVVHFQKLDELTPQEVEVLEKKSYNITQTSNGHTYRARRIYSTDLRNVNPFLFLTQEDKAKNNMRAQTLVIVGVKFENGNEGFILLADTANLLHGDRGSGEELLDHSCAVASTP